MAKARITLGVFLGSFLILLAGHVLAEPSEVAEYKDPRSGNLFELFKEQDGSFFCSVKRADGSLTGFEVEDSPATAGADDGEVCPDIRSIAESYYETVSRGRSSASKHAGDTRRGDAIRHRKTGGPLSGARHEDTLETGKSEAKNGECCRDVCYRRARPDPPGSSRKTVSLLLLLMLSERGAS
jgi:hypothetical protein